MARNPITAAVGLALAPARLAGRVAGGIADMLGIRARPPEPPSAPPKDLDDVTIARKVESNLFRDRKVAKGKVDVNVADGVAWLRGEVKTPDLVRLLEARAQEVPEVKRVENLLHLPKTPAPSRTDTPASQRKTRRSKPRPAERKVTPRGVSDEQAAPEGAEPSPRTAGATRRGRSPAPLGAEEERPAGPDPTGGPDVERLDEDPAYNPTEAGLRDLKGG